MSTTRKWVGTLAATVMFLASTSAISQDASKENSTDTNVADGKAQEVSKKKEKQPTLADVTRVSTAEAAREAAQKTSKEKARYQESDQGEDSSVLEFKPASTGENAGAKPQPTDSSKRTKKNVHGEGYGALDPGNSGNHQTGGAVGATTKTGKTSVYVESNQTRSTSPTPH